MISTASSSALAASNDLPFAHPVPYVNFWQLDEDLRFPLYRKWTKPTKKGPLKFQRDSLPEHDVYWHNRETRRSKWFEKLIGGK